MLKDLDATLGVYPVMSALLLEPCTYPLEPVSAVIPLAHPQAADANKEPGETCGNLDGFIRDREASISLWAVPLDHACVPESECSGEIQDEGGKQQTAPDSNYTPDDVHGGVPNSSSGSKAIRIAVDFRTSEG